MADVSLSGRSLVDFINAYLFAVQMAMTSLPRWDVRRPIVKYPGPQFEFELKLVGHLLDAKAALDFESNVYKEACFPGWHPDVEIAVRVAVRELSRLVRKKLKWNIEAVDLGGLRGEVARREVELEEAREALEEASRRTFDPGAGGLQQDVAEAAKNKVISLKEAPLVGEERAVLSGYELDALVAAAKTLQELRPRVELVAATEGSEWTEKLVPKGSSPTVKPKPAPSVKPLPQEEQEPSDTLPPLKGRTDRQVIEQDGVTPEVLSWGGMRLGGLIELYDGIENERRRLKSCMEDLPAPQRADAAWKCDDSFKRHLKEKVSPYTKRLEELSHHLYGADLNPETLRRMRGKISHEHPELRANLDLLPLVVVEILLTWNTNSPKHKTPRWDGRVLWAGNVKCRELTRSGTNVEAILDEFQDQDWPESIENPLTKQDIKDIKRSLNEGHNSDSCITFHIEKKTRIGWKFNRDTT